MDDFKHHRSKIEKEIVECVIAGLEKEILKEEELPLIGKFVLEKIDTITNHHQLVNFLSELSSKWPVFSTIEKIEAGELKEEAEDEVAQGVLTLLKHGKIDDALSLAKNETSR